MIQLKNVILRRGTKVVLDSVSTTINPGENVGLVGRNGAGKSSLFALLTHVLHEDSGDFSIPTQWRMGQVAQDMPETSQSATDFVVEGDTTLLAAHAEANRAKIEAVWAELAPERAWYDELSAFDRIGDPVDKGAGAKIAQRRVDRKQLAAIVDEVV